VFPFAQECSSSIDSAMFGTNGPHDAVLGRARPGVRASAAGRHWRSGALIRAGARLLRSALIRAGARLLRSADAEVQRGRLPALLCVTIWVLLVRLVLVVAYSFAGCAGRTRTCVWVMVSRRRKVLCDLFRTLPEEPVCS